LNDDIEAMTRRECDEPVVTLSEDAIKNCALYEIDQVLIRNEHRLEDFSTLPKSNYILLFMEETDWSRKSWLMISIH